MFISLYAYVLTFNHLLQHKVYLLKLFTSKICIKMVGLVLGVNKLVSYFDF